MIVTGSESGGTAVVVVTVVESVVVVSVVVVSVVVVVVVVGGGTTPNSSAPLSGALPIGRGVPWMSVAGKLIGSPASIAAAPAARSRFSFVNVPVLVGETKPEKLLEYIATPT